MPNGIAPSVQADFDTARKGINQDFATAGRSGQAYAKQAFAQSGALYDTNQRSDTMLSAATDLEKERRGAMRNLDFSEANAGLSQFNALMNLLGGGAGTALNLAGGFSNLQAGANSLLSNQSPGYGALSGGLAGAGAGASLGPYGALAGGLLGAAGGYFGAG